MPQIRLEFVVLKHKTGSMTSNLKQVDNTIYSISDTNSLYGTVLQNPGQDLDLGFIPPVNYTLIFVQSIFIGFITGLVGAGGGFLIIPALILFAHIPMKKAIGTSLLIITTNSAIGFMSVLKSDYIIDWTLLSIFTTASVIGIFIGFKLSKKIAGEKLKKGFGYFILLMGIFIILNEIFIKG